METAGPLKQVLLTLQRRADIKNQPAEFSWEALNNILQNVQGTSIDYASFKAEFDADPTMKTFIKGFNSQGVVIKTRNKDTDEPQVGDQDKGASDINTMAKRAAAKEIGA
jgi:hypothetical protein